MDYITLIGLMAAFLTTIALLPQLLRVWKTKSTKDISVGMFTLQCGSVSLWAIYGVFMNDIAIIAANSLVFVQAATMLLFKNKYK
jgi:MtN3 and saliva related transmembrane protein